MNTYQLPPDNRPAQATRVADYLEQHPVSTAKEIDAQSDTGCITRVVSDMPRLGYGLRKGWRFVQCDRVNRTRQVRTYTLLNRPKAHPDLFEEQLIRAALEDLKTAGQLPATFDL